MTQEHSRTSGRKDTNGGEREQAQDVSNKPHEVAEQVKQATLERVEAVRDSTRSAKEQAAERVRKFGSAVRKVGEHLRVEDQGYAAQKAVDASQQLDKFANYLSSAQLGTLLRDTSELARNNSAAFLGGAFVVGLAAGRFLKTGANGTTGMSSTGGTSTRGSSSTSRANIGRSPGASSGSRTGAQR